jgi:membrane-associated phospholipid phosphatase
MPVQRYLRLLHAADVVIISFGGILSLLGVVFAGRVPQWRGLLLLNCLLAAAIWVVASAAASRKARFARIVHDWYVVPAIILYYKELFYLVGPMRGGRDYDQLLIAIDRCLFGVDPTKWLARLASPPLTEFLQIGYTSFYLLFVLVGFELYRRYRHDEYDFFAFLCAYGFFLSYAGYFLFPAAGPRFTLHDHSLLNSELPGLLLTPYLRWFVDWGGSVPMGVPNSVAMAKAPRDIFPSGHTMMTLVLVHCSFRCRVRLRYVVLAAGILIITAAVYQRYHYVMDIIAGALFAILCLMTSRAVYGFIRRRILGLVEA